MSLTVPPNMHPGREVFGRPTLDDIRLDALSQTEWRVVDQRLPQDDAPSVLGFIELVDSGYETLVLGHGSARWTYETLDEARQHFIR